MFIPSSCFRQVRAVQGQSHSLKNVSPSIPLLTTRKKGERQVSDHPDGNGGCEAQFGKAQKPAGIRQTNGSLWDRVSSS
jgi:hypothetical protein